MSRYSVNSRDQSIPADAQQTSTQDGRGSAMKLCEKFHLETGRLKTSDGKPLVLNSDFKDQSYIYEFSRWLITARMLYKPDEYYAAGSCTQYLSHVKEYYKAKFPNEALFKNPKEDWFNNISSLMVSEIFRRLIDDGDELTPNKSKTAQREEMKDGMKTLLVKDDGKSYEALEMMAPIATNRQAVGR